MKKIYSIVLMAAMLLVGTNVWAVDVASRSDLQTAIDNTPDGGTVDITLTADVTIGANDTPIQIYAKKAVTGKTVNINFNGHNIASAGNDKPNVLIELFKGTLNLNGTGYVTTKGRTGIKVYGYEDPTKANWSVLNVGEHITVESFKKEAIGIYGFYGKYYPWILHSTQQSGEEEVIKGYSPKTYDGEGDDPMHYYKDSADYLAFEKCDYTKSATDAIALVKSGKIDYVTSYPSYYAFNEDKAGTSTSYYRKYTKGGVTYRYVYCYEKTKAYGVNVTVYGKLYGEEYGIKMNGTIKYPRVNESDNMPYVHIASTAEVSCAKTAEYNPSDPSGATAIYVSGCGQWLIEGYVHGNIGVYVKSGEVTINNAVVVSDNKTNNHNAITGTSSGILGGEGSAIVVESNAHFQGGQDVTISGNTKVYGANGYAVEEVVTNTENSKVSQIEVTGGEFNPGQEGTITVTQKTTSGENTTVTITGGTVNGQTSDVNLGGQTLQQFLQDQTESTHATVVATDEAGNTTIVISEGAAPTPKNTVKDAEANSSVNWMNTDVTEETLTKDLKLTELQISQNYNQKLIVPAGKTLEVGRVVLGAKAQIVVKPGAKFVVTGEQGLAAYQESNLILETQEGNPAIFLFNPAVTSNTHPMATVEFLSKSYVASAEDWALQCFGIPTYEAMTAIDAFNKDDDTDKVRTKFGRFNYATNAWEVIGEINSSNPAVDLNDMADPFNYYQMINYGTVMGGTKVVMKGRLVGNEIPQLNIRGNFWNGYANSCTAPMDIDVLLGEIPTTVQKAIYLLDINGHQTTWIARNYANEDDEDMQEIAPLQPFLINNAFSAANVEVSYEEVVYNPAMGIVPNQQAPARRVAANDMTKAKMIVNGENCTDRVIVIADDEFSTEFDNGYDATKYMNDGINMYVSANEKMAIFATDNLDNTFVGFQTVNGGNYTIEFANVYGKELTLIDHETGARVAMVEGNVYEFTAAANSVNDYRFEIVESAKLPTAIDNTEAVKSAKGIYTITGQYLGEMNVWNTLPAGVYVINGEKRVK